MNTYQIKRCGNGKIIAKIKADSAEDALTYMGYNFSQINDTIEKIIAENGLNFINYSTTYAFDVLSGVVAVQEV